MRALPAASRRWYEGRAFDAHYPINFVVKHPCLRRFFEKARPEAERNLPGFRSCDRRAKPVSGSASFLENGGDQETVNENGGAERDRTADPLLAKQVLSQLSYSPKDSWCSDGRLYSSSG